MARKRAFSGDFGVAKLTVEEVEDPGKGMLGYFDPVALKIAIKKDQDWVEKNTTLLHELIHLVDYSLVRSGFTKRLIPHNWINHACKNLLYVLVMGGVWQGISKDVMYDAYKKEVRRTAARKGWKTRRKNVKAGKA